MKKTILLLTLLFPVSQISAQTSVKLNGTPIGTQGYEYFDGGGGQPSNSVNTIENCFDGDLNTFFASAIDESRANGGEKGSRSNKGGWVGLDLGEKHVIKSVKYAPRLTQAGRVECAIIEGANSPDFMDAVAIGIIADAAPENQLSTLNINSTRGFRYVRYYGSLQYRCNIAELEFWGERSNGNDSHIGQITNLPTVNIHTENEATINSKETYITGTISVIDGNTAVEDGLSIRGRGNASWNFKKRPYRIKFDNSTYILGNPAKAKNWTLISNEGDKTLLRNLLAFDISKRLEMPYTPAGKLVDVVINGDYKGCYQLCDHIDLRAGRVHINEMASTDIDGTAITGGYLIEIDAYLKDEYNWQNGGFESSRQVPVTIKSPDEDVRIAEQTNYIKNHFNNWENSVMAQDFSDPENGFRRYTDIETFCRHFLIGEFAGNTDTYWSVYLYKKRNDDKFYFGPIWDYDLAFENDQRTYSIMEKTAANSNRWLYQWGGNDAHNTDPLIDRLLSDADLYQRLKDIWAQYRNSGAISETALMQTIDDYAAKIEVSQTLNFKRWDNLNQWEHMMWERGNYTDNINIVKNYIKERLIWIDQKFDYVPSQNPNAANNIEFRNVNIFSKNSMLIINNLPEPTKIECYDISGKIIFEINTKNSYSKSLPQGIYIVKLTKQNGVFQTFKCTVQ